MLKLTSPSILLRKNIIMSKPVYAALALLLSSMAASAHAETSPQPAPRIKILSEIAVGGEGSWDYASLDASRRALYVAHNAHLVRIDLNSGQVAAQFADSNGAHIALPLPGAKALLLTQGAANKASFIDADTGQLIASLDTASKPDGAIYDPASARAFVLDNAGAEVDVIDPAAMTITSRISVPGAPEGSATDGGGLVFTHLEDKNKLVVLDAEKLAVKAVYPLEGCESPSGMAYIDGRDMVLSACDNGVARLTDTRTGAAVATLAIGEGPDGAVYDARRELAYIPCRDGTLSVIALNGAPRVIQTLKTIPGARTIALDPDSGRIYLPVADLAPASESGGKPDIIPGSFRILVAGTQ